ncbi:MAG: class I SAM-dependent methyltransferase [Terriglobales bacterium]
MTDSVMPEKTQRTYLPAAGLDVFLPLYDGVTRLMGLDKARAALLETAGLQPGQRVLDIGCGTGSLAVALKRRYSQIEVFGLDPDPKALARANRKAQQAGVSVEFHQGCADALSYPTGFFDRVFSSFMFHHLEHDQKEGALREVRRVLKPGGRLHLLDFSSTQEGGSHSFLRLLHSHGRLKDNTTNRILALLASAGLGNPRVVGTRRVLLGLSQAVFYEASAP